METKISDVIPCVFLFQLARFRHVELDTEIEEKRWIIYNQRHVLSEIIFHKLPFCFFLIIMPVDYVIPK